MSLATEIYGEIRIITQHLTEASICQENRFPAIASRSKGITEVYPEDSMDLGGMILGKMLYRDAYDSVRRGKAYNVMLLDGALLDFRYCVHPKRRIVKHTLSFWPSARLLSSDQTPWVYDEDEPFGDAVDERGVLPVPVRFDYAPEQFLEYDHPNCHATLGQYPNCRIAIAGPVRPGVFLNFVLHNFYRREISNLGKHFPFKLYDSDRCITSGEAKNMLHFMLPGLK